MAYTLSSLTPEEKLAKYNELNSTPDASTYVSLNPTAPTPYINKPVETPTTIDYTGGYTPVPSNLSSTTTAPSKDSPAIGEVTTKPSVIGSAVKPIPAINYQPFNEYSYKPSGTPLNLDNFESRIRMKESNNNPAAVNKKSSASGYYQFLWNDWHDSIKNVTGITDRDTFLHSPDAQKSFFKFYYENHILPNVRRIKNALGSKNPLSDFDLAQLIHFRGAGNAQEMIEKGELNQKKETYNPTALDYMSK